MRSILYRPLLLLVAFFCLAMNANASITFFANLTHDQEPGAGPVTTSTGAPRPLSFGLATFVLNDAGTELSMSATIFGIDVNGTQTPDSFDNLTAAHIHVATTNPAAPTFPVRWGFFGAPDNDNNPDNLVVTPFASGVGGTFTSIWNAPEGNASTTLATNLPNILAERSYLNFHTTQFPGGEIRGTLTVVPEPSTLVIFGIGVFGLFGRQGWRRSRAG